MRALKALVVFLGVLIVAGVAVLVYAFIDRIPAGRGAGFGEVAVSLPFGCVVAQANLSESVLVLRAEGPAESGCRQILLLDAKTGRLLGRVNLELEP